MMPVLILTVALWLCAPPPIPHVCTVHHANTLGRSLEIAAGIKILTTALVAMISRLMT